MRRAGGGGVDVGAEGRERRVPPAEAGAREFRGEAGAVAAEGEGEAVGGGEGDAG